MTKIKDAVIFGDYWSIIFTFFSIYLNGRLNNSYVNDRCDVGGELSHASTYIQHLENGLMISQKYLSP